MADQDYEVGATLRWDSDNSKLTESQGLVNELTASIEGLATKAAAAFGGLFAVTKIVEWLREGAAEALRMESALAALRSQVEMLGGDSAAAVAGAEALHEKFESIGIEGEKAINAVTKLTMVTGGNYVDAMRGAELAARASIEMHVSFEKALMLVQYAMEGSPRSVGVALRQFGIHAKNAQGVLDELYKRTTDINPALDTMANRLDRANLALSEMGRNIGSVWNVIKVAAVDAVGYVVTFAEAAFLEVGSFITSVVDLVIRGKDTITKGADEATRLYREREAAHIKDYEAGWDDVSKRLSELWNHTAADAGKAMEKPFVVFTGLGDAMVKEWEDRQKKMLKDREEAMDVLAKEWQKNEQSQLDGETKAKEQRKKNVFEYLKLVEDEQTAIIQDEAKAEQVRLQQEQQYLAKRKTMREKQVSEEDHIIMRGVNMQFANDYKVLQSGIAAQEKLLANATITGEARAQIEQRLADLKMTLAATEAETALGIMATAFPQIKAFAVAEAIISTLVAAVNASKMEPFIPVGIAAMAMALAMGFAKVEAIEGTSPGGGKGSGGGGGGATIANPTMPSVYSSYGPNTGAGVPSTMVQQTHNAPVINNVTINAIDTNNALRTIQTKWRPSSRNYDRGIVNRTPTTIGSKRGG